MTLRPLSRDDARAIDKRCEEIGLATVVLMENAGRGAAEILRRELAPTSRIVVVCGEGNNGGDGGVVARHLDAWGFPTLAVWFRARTGGLSLAQRDILAAASRVAIEDAERADLSALFAAADWIVDGLFGTGLNRPAEGLAREAIAAMNRSGKPILALDLPSGLDADTGEALGAAVRATITATFVAPKIGFANPRAIEFLGRVEVVEIGAPRRILEPYEGE